MCSLGRGFGDRGSVTPVHPGHRAYSSQRDSRGALTNPVCSSECRGAQSRAGGGCRRLLSAGRPGLPKGTLMASSPLC